jgi:ankyrin repeat protein
LAEIVNIDGRADEMSEEVSDTWLTNMDLAVHYFSPERGDTGPADTGNSDLLQILLRRPGANPNIKNGKGETPLHTAAYFKNVNAINILVSSGGNINAQNNELRTPVMYATQWGDQTLLETVLKHGGDPKMKDIAGETCLHKFSSSYRNEDTGFENVIDMLLEHGADLDESDDAQKTTLMAVVNNSTRDTCNDVETLLKKGANVNMRDENGHTAFRQALDLFTHDHHGRMAAKIEILLKYGATPSNLGEMFMLHKYVYKLKIDKYIYR